MNDFRVKKQFPDGYTLMGNTFLKDTRLSCKAVGLLAKMLSLPDNWDYSVSGLSKICKEGRDAIRNTINELINYGYIIREEQCRNNGQFGSAKYIVDSSPMVENNELSPCAENQTSVKQASEILPQLNTKELNTKELNTKKDKTYTCEKKEKQYFPENELLNKAFLDYIAYRKEMKSKMTDRAIQMAGKQLLKMASNDEERIAILNQSIMNGWKGLFALRKITGGYNNGYVREEAERDTKAVNNITEDQLAAVERAMRESGL